MTLNTTTSVQTQQTKQQIRLIFRMAIIRVYTINTKTANKPKTKFIIINTNIETHIQANNNPNNNKKALAFPKSRMRAARMPYLPSPI